MQTQTQAQATSMPSPSPAGDARRLRAAAMVGAARRLAVVASVLSAVAPAAAGVGPAAAVVVDADPPPLAARYRLTDTAGGRTADRPRTVRATWYFQREPDRIALIKGDLEEIWHRQPNGGVSFERVVHPLQRVVDYSAGELAALGVAVEWAALTSLLDARELASLRLVSQSGAGTTRRLHLHGSTASGRLRVEWLPAWQLPARIERRGRDGRITEFRLDTKAARALSDWPRLGVRSASYLRIDAADFGDMEREPVVRLSEALDARLGWRRTGHAHD